MRRLLVLLASGVWELAVYPVEDHGFVEETSWADEFKRILKLFEEHLKSGDGRATSTASQQVFGYDGCDRCDLIPDTS